MIDSTISIFVANYFNNLINRFFKILPMREQNNESLEKYVRSLQMEMMGCKVVLESLDGDPLYISLLSILGYFCSNPECDLSELRREVFRAISICEKLRDKYSDSKEADA